jgi:hypothetical protein
VAEAAEALHDEKLVLGEDLEKKKKSVWVSIKDIEGVLVRPDIEGV